MGPIIPTLLLSLAGASLVNAYWLMGISMSQFRSGACKEVLTRTNPFNRQFHRYGAHGSHCRRW